MKLLLIGPLPPPLGGATILFKQLVDDLSCKSSVAVTTINTSRIRTGKFSNLLHALWALIEMTKFILKIDVVSFHTSKRGALLFGPLVWLVCRIFGKKWIFRGFGGNFDEYYKNLSNLTKFIFKVTVLQADILLFETKSTVKYFKNIVNRPVLWYSNSRRFSRIDHEFHNNRSGAQRFVYVGHVTASKGINEIIEAGEMIDDTIDIDIYGPLMEGMKEENFHGKKTRYMGILQPEKVMETMKQYDALLFPTYYKGEGYPGVILEAYFAGLPVITTRWRAIPEIVDSSSGILIEPKNSKQLAEAMQQLIQSGQQMQELRLGAISMARRFSSEIWTKYFLEINQKLAGAN